MVVVVFVVAIASLCLGITIGHSVALHGLTINTDRRGVSGPHLLRGDFYYLVPESFWTAKLCTCARDDLAREVPAIGGD